MPTSYTQAIEDYLKAIYELSAGKAVTTNQLARQLGIAPASVTGMLQKLTRLDPPLIVYQKHHGVRLTAEGERAALEIVRHHRLIELFLYRMLGYPWDEVHSEADRLEHVISEDFEERLSQLLGDPSRDPHGDPIPDRDLVLPPYSSTRLSELRPGQTAVLQRVHSSDPDLLRYLSQQGVVPQAEVKILTHSPFDGNLQIQVAGQDEPVVLGPAITRLVYTEPREAADQPVTRDSR